MQILVAVNGVWTRGRSCVNKKVVGVIVIAKCVSTIFLLLHALCPPQYGTTSRKLGRENTKSSAR